MTALYAQTWLFSDEVTTLLPFEDFLQLDKSGRTELTATIMASMKKSNDFPRPVSFPVFIFEDAETVYAETLHNSGGKFHFFGDERRASMDLKAWKALTAKYVDRLITKVTPKLKEYQGEGKEILDRFPDGLRYLLLSELTYGQERPFGMALSCHPPLLTPGFARNLVKALGPLNAKDRAGKIAWQIALKTVQCAEQSIYK